MQPSSNNCYDTGLREECGVFGIYDLDGADVSPSIYYGLSALQHRGQESCGIAVSDTSGPKGHVKSYKGLGLVNEVFKESKLEELSGNIGIGHVRYSTTGSTTVENAQPLVLNYLKGSLSLSHNGNLVNAMELREQMENTGAIFHTSIDSEIIAYGIARERVHSKTVEEAILRTVKEIRGAYALVIMSPRKLIGVRDPYGLKPLCIGKRDNAWVLASESCALTSIGAEFVRDVAPGEIVTFDKTGNLKSEFMPVDVKKAHCIFEYIYFARLDSKIDNISVYEARIRGGATLAKTYPVDADLVCGVPDSGLASAKGYSEESGIPFGLAFHKNSYVGRTFIKPTQKERESSVKIKLSVLESVVKGKRIVLVDDSIVRGTTISNLITMLRKAGATEVHVRISSPPFLYPCYFGTDVPSNKQLIASSHSTEEIRQQIGADSHADRGTPEHGRRSADLPCMLRQPLPNGSTETGYQRSSRKLILFRPPYRADTASGKGAFLFHAYFDVMFAYNSIKNKGSLHGSYRHHLFQRLHQHSDPELRGTVRAVPDAVSGIKCSSYAEPAVFRSLSRAESAAGKSLRRSSLYRASKTFYAALHALTGSLRDCPDAESLRRRIYRQKCNLRFSGHRH